MIVISWCYHSNNSAHGSFLKKKNNAGHGDLLSTHIITTSNDIENYINVIFHI